MNTTVLWACLICLVISIILDNKFKLPMGLVCMVSACIISYLAFGTSASRVVSSYFPGSIVLPLILAMMYFAVFNKNGTTQIIAGKILGVIKGNMKLYPWVLYLCTFPLYICFDGNALKYIMAPLIFGIAKAGGCSTLMAISTIYYPFVSGSMNAFIGMDASTRLGILTDMGFENGQMISIVIWLFAIIMMLATHLVVYIVTGSWKVKNTPYVGAVKGEKQSFTADQKKSLLLLLVTVIVFVVPPFAKMILPCKFTNALATIFVNYNIFVLGLLAILVLRLGNYKDIAKTVSMPTILMIVGVTFLVKTAQAAGLQQLCTSVASAVPSWLIGPVLLLISAALSFFIAAPTILPMLMPMAAALAVSPELAFTYLTCVALGAAASGISPISNAGASTVAAVLEEDRDVCSKSQFILAFLGPVVMALVAATGIFQLIGKAFAGWYF